MKTQFNIKTNFAKGLTKFHLVFGALLLVSASLASCNSNSSNGGKTTASHDTSSAVSNRVDTIGGGSKQP